MGQSFRLGFGEARSEMMVAHGWMVRKSGMKVKEREGVVRILSIMPLDGERSDCRYWIVRLGGK